MIVVQAVRSDAFAGVERYIATVAPRLVARGIEVQVIGGAPAEMQAALGGAVSFTEAATTPSVVKALRGVKADVVHTHMTAAEFAAALAAPRRQVIVSTRHFLGRRGASMFGGVTAPFVRRRLRHQISVSDAVAASIGEPSTRLYNGVVNRPAGPHRSTNVLVLQRLEPEKDTAWALRAWALAQARHDGWVLDIGGDGSQRAALETLAGALGLSESVRFLGHITDTDAHLADAGIVLATAPREPFGLSVVEAMASAAPVVAAAGGGHLETVGGVADAQLYPVGDAAACAARVDQLVAQPDDRASYGLALQQRQREVFDIEAHVSSLVELYERVAV